MLVGPAQRVRSHRSSQELDEAGDNPVDAIVSVLMLREGWDVQNVTVVGGLRPYTAKANNLPEQKVGRGSLSHPYAPVRSHLATSEPPSRGPVASRVASDSRVAWLLRRHSRRVGYVGVVSSVRRTNRCEPRCAPDQRGAGAAGGRLMVAFSANSGVAGIVMRPRVGRSRSKVTRMRKLTRTAAPTIGIMPLPSTET